MSTTDSDRQDGPVPAMQRLYDRPFVLLAAGLIVMFGFYTIWGALELWMLPTATLP